MLNLPPLVDYKWRRFGVCVHLDIDKGEKVAADDQRIAKVGRATDNSELACRRIVDGYDDYLHFHIEIGLASDIRFKTPLEDDFTLLEIPDWLHGKNATVTVWSRLHLKRAELPDNGLIKMLAGVAVPAGDYELTISGGTLDVSGDGPIYEVKWWVAGESEMGLEPTASIEMNVDDDLLVKAAAKLHAESAVIMASLQSESQRGSDNAIRS